MFTRSILVTIYASFIYFLLYCQSQLELPCVWESPVWSHTSSYVSSNCLDLLLYIHTDHMESATPSCTDGWGDQQVGDDHDHELKAYVSTNCLNLLLCIHIDHMEYSTPSVLIIENFKKFTAVTSKENHKTLQKNHSTRFKLN